MFEIVLNFIVLASAILSLNIFSIDFLVFDRMNYFSLISGLVSVAFMVYPIDLDED